MKKTVIYFVIILSTYSCENNSIPDKYITSTEWVLDEGDIKTVGDFLLFDSTKFYTLSNDTIFRLNSPVGIIFEIDTVRGVLEIKSLDGLESGTWLDLNKKYKY